MFSVPFWHFTGANIDIHKKHKTKLLNFFDEWNKKHPQENDKSDVLTDFYHYGYNHQRPPYFSYVVEALSDALNGFYNDLGKSFCFGDFWFQQTVNYQRHSLHNHGSSGFSAIWYLEFDPQHHSSTRFYSPFPDSLDGFTVEAKEPVTQEGDFFIFPSFLLHEQTPSFSNKRRTIISFNLKEKDKTYSQSEQI